MSEVSGVGEATDGDGESIRLRSVGCALREEGAIGVYILIFAKRSWVCEGWERLG